MTSLCTYEQRTLSAPDTKAKIYPWCIYNEYYQRQISPVFLTQAFSVKSIFPDIISSAVLLELVDTTGPIGRIPHSFL